MAPITDNIKKWEFTLTSLATKAIVEIKDRLNVTVLVPRDFGKVFEEACDASSVGIGRVLSQEGHPIAFFSKN